MRRLDAYKVDAFTTTPYAGNAAGVVPDAEGLGERQMGAIGREMGVSETAFILPPDAPGAAMRLRYFTPTEEIPLCGHATIATFHLLAEMGRLRPPARVALQTGAGVLDVEVREGPEVWMASEPLVAEKPPLAAVHVAELLGVAPEALLPEPSLVVSRKLFVPVRGLKALEAMRPQRRAMAEDCRRHGLEGIVPVSFETFGGDALTHVRFFAPAVGIDEDPVTGTAHMGLAAYLVSLGRLRPPARFVGEQGHFVGRPGRVMVEVEGTPDALRVRVGGRAVTVLSGSMLAPP